MVHRSARFDPIGVLEAAYRFDVDDPTWVSSMIKPWGERFGTSFSTEAFFWDPRVNPTSPADLERQLRFSTRTRDDPLYRAAVDFVFSGNPDELNRAVVHCAEMGVMSVSEQARHFTAWSGALARAARAHGLGAQDHFGVAVLGETSVLAIGALQSREIRPTARERRAARPLLEHLRAALRLRERWQEPSRGTSRLAGAEAVFGPDGRSLGAVGVARGKAAQSSLREAVLAMDRARRRGGRSDIERALCLWRGLIEGRWTLVERFESDGRRLVLAFENRCRLTSPRALTSGEARALRLLGQGHSSARIADMLQISEPAVSQRLRSALRKLGARSLTELALWGAKFERAEVDGYLVEVPGGAGPGERPAGPRFGVLSTHLQAKFTGLSASELQAIELVLHGQSREAIAASRGVALSTVNNQLSSAYRKLGVSSARELTRLEP